MADVPLDSLTVAVVQMTSGHDREANVAKAVDLVAEAAKRHQAQLVVLPEFFNVEYVFTRHDPSLVCLAEPDDGPSVAAIATVARELTVTVVATILEEDSPGHVYDTAIFIGPEGRIIGKYRKTHPAATASLEKVFFRPGSHFSVTSVPPFEVGVNICYDNELPESARCSALNGATLLLAPFATPKQMPLREVLITRAADNQLFLAAANKVGREGDLDFCGTSLIISPEGEVLAAASETREEVVSATLKHAEIAATRAARPIYRDRRPDLYSSLVTPPEDLPRRRARR